MRGIATSRAASLVMAAPTPPAAPVAPGAGADGDPVRGVIDALPILAWTTRADGSVDYFNRPWLEFTGLTPEQALDWGWVVATHPEDQKQATRTWQAAIESGQPVETELRLRRADGAYVWFLVRAQALRDEEGRVLKWFGTNTEIEERRRAEQALRDSELKFRQIADSVPGLIYTAAPDGEVEFVNQPLLDYLGVGLDVLRQWKQTEHVHPEDLPRVIEEATRGFASRQPFTVEERLRRHDGVYRRVRLRITPMVGAGGEVVRWYGLLFDVEEQQAAEADLAHARARLSRAMQLAAVSELAAAIAQEIGRPLKDVVDNASVSRQALSDAAPDIPLVLRHSERIVADAQLAADSVRRIRGLFRPTPARRELLNLNEVVAEVRVLVADDLRRSGARLTTDLQSDLPLVLADRMQMQQVILGLLRNGLDAVDGDNAAQAAFTLMSRHEGGEVSIRIGDPGCRDDPSAVGPALAAQAEESIRLAVCRSIVQEHGGRFWASGKGVDGLCSGFALPLRTSSPEAPG